MINLNRIHKNLLRICTLSLVLLYACSETEETYTYTPGEGELHMPLKTGNSWTFMEYITDSITTWPNGIKTLTIKQDSAEVVWMVTGSTQSGQDKFFHIDVRYPQFPERNGFFTLSNRYNRIYMATQSGYNPFRYNISNIHVPQYLMHFEYYSLDYGTPFNQDGQSEFSTGWQVVTPLGIVPAARGVYTFYLSGHFGNLTETTAWYFSPLKGVTKYSFHEDRVNRNSARDITSIEQFYCEGRFISCRLN